MDQRLIREKTKNYLDGKWLNVVKVLAIIWIIDFALGLIFRNNSAFGLIVDLYGTFSDVSTPPKIISMMAFFTTGGLLGGIVTSFVVSTLSAGFTMTLLKSIQDGTDITLNDMIQTIQDHLVDILIISVVSSIIYALLLFLFFIGTIISVVISYMFAFAFFILKDGRAHDGVDALKKSVKETKGYKFDLFQLSFYYFIRPFLGLLIVIVGGLFYEVAPMVTAVVATVGFGVALWLYVLYTPYTHVVVAMAYEEVKEVEVV